jgi:hypothetical protein
LPAFGFYNGLPCQTSPNRAKESFPHKSCLGKSCLARERLLRRDDAEVMTAGVTHGSAFDNNPACA